jgi:hypothetical protein
MILSVENIYLYYFSRKGRDYYRGLEAIKNEFAEQIQLFKNLSKNQPKEKEQFRDVLGSVEYFERGGVVESKADAVYQL